MSTRGRRIASWSAGLGVLILIGTGFVGRHLAREYWYTYKLESPNDAEKRAAAEVLVKMRSARAAPRILEAFAESSDFEEWIRRVVEELGPRARTAVATLVAALDHRNDDVRVAAARALRHLGANAREALPALIGALTDRDTEIRSCAAETLEKIGSDAALAVPALMRALNDASRQVRDLAAAALAAIGSAAVPPLVEALTRVDGGAQDPLVVWTLGEIGSEASSAAQPLEKVLYADHAGLRRRAAIALGKIGPGAVGAIPALERVLKDPDDHVRLAALEALKELGRPRGESPR